MNVGQKVLTTPISNKPSLIFKLSLLPLADASFSFCLTWLIAYEKDGNRCDVRSYTSIPMGAAVIIVELMLTLRVLALCELLMSSHKIVTYLFLH